MDRHFYEKVFSTQRMAKYFDRYPDNERKAIFHYKINVELSESFYPLLSMYEVALRNSMSRELADYFQSANWHLKMETAIGLKDLRGNLNAPKRQIVKRNENISSHKMVAELTLGFWVRLFNAEYERILWKPLRRAFPYLEKSERQRHKVSAPINKIRDFRNRLFHHEPISWNLEKLEETHQRILKVMGWINKDLPEVANSINRVPDVIRKAEEKLGGFR